MFENKFQLAPEDNIFSKKSKLLKIKSANKPYWDNTHPIQNAVDNKDEIEIDKNPQNGYKLLHQIYGKKGKLNGGKRTAAEIKSFLDASYDKKPPKKIGEWNLDEKLSKPTAVVYHNPTTNETVVSHRGTQGASDWGNNLAYATGLYNFTSRYKEGKKVQNQAEKKYGKENISTIGHSQGAVLARKLGSDTKEVINVNPAYLGETPKKNEYNIRSSTDKVSQLYKPVASVRSILYPKYAKKHDITIDSKSYNPLTEHKVDILDRLNPNQEIGVGGNLKKITMKEREAHLIEYGIPKKAVTLLKKTKHIKQVCDAIRMGDDILPLLEEVLSRC